MYMRIENNIKRPVVQHASGVYCYYNDEKYS